MSELIVEARGPEAKELFEEFEGRHRDHSSIETGNGADGATLLSLVIENAPALSASVVALIATLQKRGLRFKVSKDGVEMAVGDADKLSL